MFVTLPQFPLTFCMLCFSLFRINDDGILYNSLICVPFESLQEANVLNNRDSEVWANLSLLCLTLGREFEANQCISQALALGIREVGVLRYTLHFCPNMPFY